jgi:catechol 2,3-dioxygenase-like lactoylglutathione lyase family enzyme
MDVKITGVHHIMITVGNIYDAKSFYSSVLGFEQMEIPDYVTGPRLWYKLGSIELHVNEHPKYKAGNSHFAITVEEDKYNEYISKIEATGYKKRSTCEKYVDGYYRLYIHDPFDNCIEIINAQAYA